MIPTETRWRDFLQPTMCRPRTADIWTADIWTADIRRGGAVCRQRSRQRCYCNATAHLQVRDADYGTKTRRRCGSVVQAKLYVAVHSLSCPSERHLCKSTIVTRQQQQRNPAIIARLQRGAAARRRRVAARPSRRRACDGGTATRPFHGRATGAQLFNRRASARSPVSGGAKAVQT